MILQRVVHEGLTGKGNLSKDLKEARERVVQVSGEEVPGTANSKCKGPVVGAHLTSDMCEE